jgi:hypothetical protein
LDCMLKFYFSFIYLFFLFFEELVLFLSKNV